MSLAEDRRADHKISQDPNNQNWASDRGRIGFKLLQKMGWTEGKGLGLKGDGIAKAIKIVPCVEGLGIGAAEARKNKEDWTASSASYEELLSRVNVHCESLQDHHDEEKKESDRKKAKKEKKESDRKKVKKERKESDIKKERKTHTKKEKSHFQKELNAADNSVEKNTQPNEQLQSSQSSSSVWKHRSKFIKNKATSNYSSKDLSAIFGNNLSTQNSSH